MSKDVYVVDTHALAWFISQDNRLSQKSVEILHQGELGTISILIPTLVLAEMTHIAEKKRVNVTINELLSRINQGDGFNIVAYVSKRTKRGRP